MSTDDYDNPSPWMSKPSKPRSAPQKDKKNSYQSQPPPSKDTKDSYQSQPSPMKDDKGSSSPQKDTKGSSQSQTPSWKDNNKDSSQSSPKNDDKDSDSLSAPRKDESQSPPPPKKDTKDNKDNKDSKDNKDNKDNKNNNDSSSQSSQGKKDDDNDNSSSPPPPWSTPPPPKKNTPPPPLIMSSRESGTVIKNNGLTTSTKVVVAGIVIGGVLLLIGVMVCWLACCKRKKGRKAHDQMVYYRDNSTGNRSSDYYNSGPRAQNCDDHALKMPHAPDIPSHVSSEQWPEFPPPPPPQAISSDMSSAGFSTGNHQAPLPPPSPSVVLGFSQNGMFSLEDLATATGGFSKDNLLGQGGFGYVHKGILPSGKEVAVKSLKAGSGQGEREFQAEMDIINRVHHRHLVTLVGYCIAGDKRMLVYEFVPNNSLEYHLHGKGQTVIDFPSRLKIALGSAKGFAYLHEDCHPRIIHRDVKAANILLDYNFEPKVADFGLAKLSSDNYTHVSTRIMGTFGYLAPEYASSGKLTEKSDVYSFGIVLLELITGKRPVDVHNPEEDSLVDWSRPIIEDAVEGGEYEELVDPKLDGDYDPHQMLCMIACAAACIRLSAKSRPKMIQIVRALEGETSLDDLKEGMKKCSSSSGSSEYDSPYSSRKRRSKKHPNNVSQDLTSSTELGTTGEFSAQPSPLRSIGSSQEFIRRLNL